MSKVIVRSAAMYKFLSEKMEFWKSEVKIVGTKDELIIDGFRGLDCHCKDQFETEVPVEKLRQMRRMLGTISDQPITISFENYLIEVGPVLI